MNEVLSYLEAFLGEEDFCFSTSPGHKEYTVDSWNGEITDITVQHGSIKSVFFPKKETKFSVIACDMNEIYSKSDASYYVVELDLADPDCFEKTLAIIKSGKRGAALNWKHFSDFSKAAEEAKYG